MEKARLIQILFDFGYVIIFGILGCVTLFLNRNSSEKGIETFNKARNIFGISQLMMCVYCIIRLAIPQNHEEFIDFWLMVSFTLIFSWLTYVTILYLIESPRYLRRYFLVDGLIPILLIVTAGLVGVFIPHIQHIMEIIFGCIFAVKCGWMFYICHREYRSCRNEMDNYYDECSDIRWIGSLMYISLILSIATVIAFYVPATHLIYYPAIPIIYVVMVFKIVNHAPKKIDLLRKKNELINKQVETKVAKTKYADLSDKLEPLVKQWIMNKSFCQADLNIKDVATQLGTNHNYLSSYINNHLGMTFQVWLNTLRIEEAKAILTNGEKLSIEEVGSLVGIPQSYNFSRWFRTITGTTPYQYRKLN